MVFFGGCCLGLFGFGRVKDYRCDCVDFLGVEGFSFKLKVVVVFGMGI